MWGGVLKISFICFSWTSSRFWTMNIFHNYISEKAKIIFFLIQILEGVQGAMIKGKAIAVIMIIMMMEKAIILITIVLILTIQTQDLHMGNNLILCSLSSQCHRFKKVGTHLKYVMKKYHVKPLVYELITYLMPCGPQSNCKLYIIIIWYNNWIYTCFWEISPKYVW